MSRKDSWAMVAAVVLMVVCAEIHAQTPSISGSVFHDQDSNGAVSPDEGVAGAVVRLFSDNGDGIFSPSSGDVQVGEVTTLADGTYLFGDLEFGVSYFVARPAQELVGVNQPEDVSGLISPSETKLLIDSFETSQFVVADTSSPVATSSVSTDAENVLGGERDLYLQLNAGNGNAKLRVSAFGDDLLQYDTTSGVMGLSVLTWDGLDQSSEMAPAMGLDDFDLTAGGELDTLFIKMGVDRTGEGETAVFRIFDDSSDIFSEASLGIPVTDGTADVFATLALEEFSGPVDPSKIDAFQMLFGNGKKSIDAQIDFIGVGNANPRQDFQVVPEPTPIMFIVAGCIGVAFLMRRGISCVTS